MSEPLIVAFAAAIVASAAFMVATVVLMGDTAFKRSADTLSATLTVALISAAFASPIFTPATYQVPDVIHAWVNFGLAALALLLMMVTVEGAVRFPQLTWLDSYAPPDLIRQIPVFLVGILCYGCFVSLAYKISVKRFEHVDL